MDNFENKTICGRATTSTHTPNMSAPLIFYYGSLILKYNFINLYKNRQVTILQYSELRSMTL